MKKLIVLATAITVISVCSNAYAINAKYREQLERSGCTQINAGTTCDIHKTKAQNAATHPTSEGKAHNAELSELAESFLGKKVGTVYPALRRKGFIQTDPGIWYNSQTQDVLKVVVKGGYVQTISVNK